MGYILGMHNVAKEMSRLGLPPLLSTTKKVLNALSKINNNQINRLLSAMTICLIQKRVNLLGSIFGVQDGRFRSKCLQFLRM